MAHDPVEIGREVMAACAGLGFARSGIAAAEPTRYREELLSWLAAGKHGEMVYLTELLDQRLDVRELALGGDRSGGDGARVRSVLMVADRYWERDGVGERTPKSNAGETSGVIARYARGQDYHVVIKNRLHALCDRLRARFPGEWFRSFVDTGPVLEREIGARAMGGAAGGGAFVGKHTLLIDPRLGSWLLLGGVATTMELASEEAKTSPEAHCGTCTRCIDACPTGAISPWSVDATKCVSYLTIEHRGLVDPALYAGVGDRLIGCDVCQEVCPYNGEESGSGGPSAGVHRAYSAGRGGGGAIGLLEVLGWSEADRAQALSGSAAKRAHLNTIRRTAVINAGNAIARRDNPALRARLEVIASDGTEPEVVRLTARRVLGLCAE